MILAVWTRTDEWQNRVPQGQAIARSNHGRIRAYPMEDTTRLILFTFVWTAVLAILTVPVLVIVDTGALRLIPGLSPEHASQAESIVALVSGASAGLVDRA